jgi:hypothetical protein
VSDSNFSTGAVRSADANSLDFISISPIAMIALAKTCQEGATKYGAHNYELGMDTLDALNHVHRHLQMWQAGDRSEPHLPHAMWGLMAAIHFDTLHPEQSLARRRGPGCTVTPEMAAHLAATYDDRAERRKAGVFASIGQWTVRGIAEIQSIIGWRGPSSNDHAFLGAPEAHTTPTQEFFDEKLLTQAEARQAKDLAYLGEKPPEPIANVKAITTEPRPTNAIVGVQIDPNCEGLTPTSQPLRELLRARLQTGGVTDRDFMDADDWGQIGEKQLKPDRIATPNPAYPVDLDDDDDDYATIPDPVGPGTRPPTGLLTAVAVADEEDDDEEWDYDDDEEYLDPEDDDEDDDEPFDEDEELTATFASPVVTSPPWTWTGKSSALVKPQPVEDSYPDEVDYAVALVGDPDRRATAPDEVDYAVALVGDPDRRATAPAAGILQRLLSKLKPKPNPDTIYF